MKELQTETEKIISSNSFEREEHLHFLREIVLPIKTKWPHFKVLFEDLCSLAESASEDSTTVVLERAYLYDGKSLFAPLFHKGKIVSGDIRIETADERAGFVKHLTYDSRKIDRPVDFRSTPERFPLGSEMADLVAVPNVLHHVRHPEKFLEEIHRILKPGGKLYIYELLLRELHQAPDDYFRFTPWGLETILNRCGFELKNYRTAGGPFEAIAYCWQQALEYLPAGIREEKAEWFHSTGFPELMKLDSMYTQNLSRKYTSFPIGFGFFAQKA